MNNLTDKRRSERQDVTGSYATLSGNRASLVNWSREGALLANYVGRLDVGDKGPITLSITYERAFVTLRGYAEVVRKHDQKIAVNWELESESQYSEEIKKIINIFFKMTPA